MKKFAFHIYIKSIMCCHHEPTINYNITSLPQFKYLFLGFVFQFYTNAISSSQIIEKLTIFYSCPCPQVIEENR